MQTAAAGRDHDWLDPSTITPVGRLARPHHRLRSLLRPLAQQKCATLIRAAQQCCETVVHGCGRRRSRRRPSHCPCSLSPLRRGLRGQSRRRENALHPLGRFSAPFCCGQQIRVVDRPQVSRAEHQCRFPQPKSITATRLLSHSVRDGRIFSQVSPASLRPSPDTSATSALRIAQRPFIPYP